MNTQNNQENFQELLQNSDIQLESELKVGDLILGKIIKIGKDNVHIDTGTKTDGVLPKQELTDESGDVPYQEGETLELYIVSMKHGEIQLARSMGKEGDLEQLEQAQEAKIPVEGKVKQTCKGGFEVLVMNRNAFCPLSQIDIKSIGNPKSCVGQTYRFLIKQVENKGKNIVVSRRELLERERAQSWEDFANQVQTGDIVQGTVSSLTKFGAFVNLAPNLEGLVHISELSWSKISTLEEILSPGDKIWVKILKLEQDQHKKPRIELSLKQAQNDPWEEAIENFNPGMITTGTVTHTAPFGVFVELTPGVEGLVHISEISHVKRVQKPSQEVSQGDQVSVMIKEIDPKSRRISLSMRDAQGDPWLEVPQRYQKGQVVQGLVEKKENFGAFLRLELGVVGLLHASKLEDSPELSMNNLKPEQSITVSIESIDPENRKISLAPASNPLSGEWKKHAPQEEARTSLGAKLQEAFQKKQK